MSSQSNQWKDREEALDSIPNRELLERLHGLLCKGRCTDAALLEYLGEVDARRLYLEEAFPSMFEYCVRHLGMEEGVACNRIYAARAAREHPALLDALRAGGLHLTGIRLLAPLLTRENCADWIREARHRSVREIRQLIADRQPKPDVEASIRKQPVRAETPGATPEIPSPTLPFPVSEEGSRPATTSVLPAPPALESPASARASSPSAPASASRDEPLGRGRYSVKFMADEECHAALCELRALLRHEIPDGDLAAILKRAVSELLVKTRKRKFAELSAGGARKARKSVAATEDPSETVSRPPKRSPSRQIPHAIRRAVSERDESSCSFVSSSGRRCGSREFLEFDHLKPWALHHTHTIEGIALRCRAHNQAAARAVFGDRHMDPFLRQSARPPRAPDPDQMKRPVSSFHGPGATRPAGPAG